jgi:threonine/homoserine/homoserine lactone efflux protein
VLHCETPGLPAQSDDSAALRQTRGAARVVALIIRPDTPQWLQVFYGFSVASVEFLWAALVSMTILRPWIKRRFVAVSHWVDRVMGVMLIGLGLRLAIARRHE